jgi:Co/Zn/Cd efflux system component
MDPLMGIVGAVLVARWSIGLLKSTSGILLDEQAPETTLLGIRNSLEQDQNSRVVDLHVWTVAPGVYSAIISIVSTSPQDPLYYRRQLPSDIELAHITFEVQEFKLS